MKKFLTIVAAALMFVPSFTSCMDDDNDSKDETAAWRTKNLEYVTNMEALTENGAKVFERVVPVWRPGAFVLMKWHNDRALTAKNLMPLDNSLCNVTYELRNVDDEVIQTSFGLVANGDSIYQCRPNANIDGFHAALTNMHVGDSVTCIIPYQMGYGSTENNSIKAYSTLVYGIKLKEIVAYEVPR